ncbi:MAG: O-antigen ligase family protein [Piscinibacter sp.]|uniref:O-antigen ligase family protein n=1 Tax=Piscinibacter sp. TaxID=1903157 RepID=UPI00258E6C1C|nr:O-antigen ligase family protein [Piscinibacter sp.]MCW5662457.1 O-antigen ligase family protein [Piscinibacter sp.]
MITAAAFALFCLVCVVFAFTRHPIWGVYFYLATTYVYPPDRWWGYLFGGLRWALLAAAVTALAVVLHRGKLQRKPLWISTGPAILLSLYAAWMLVQFGWAMDLADHERGTTEIIKCLLAAWFVYRTLDSRDRVRDLMLAHVLGCALLGLYALNTPRIDGRLDGVGGPNLDDANTLGMYLVTAALCGVGLVMTQRGWRRLTALLCLPLIVNGFVLANSRGAFLGLVAGGVVLLYCIARKHRWIFAAFAIVGLAGLAVLVDKTFVERMFTIGDVTSQDEDADTSARSRMVIAKAQLQMFLDYPLGTGWRGTAALSLRYMDERWMAGDAGEVPSRSSHNTFLTALSEQGLPGALIYGTLLMWVAGAVLRVKRMNKPHHDPDVTSMGAALCAAIVSLLTAGLAADYLTKEVQFWLYAALSSVLWLGESVVAAAVQPGPPGASTRLQQLPGSR